MIWDDLSSTEVIVGNLKWSQMISSDLGKWRVIPFDLTLSQVFWTALQKSVDIFGDFRSSEVTSGDVKSCQGSILKYQMIWRDLSWTEVILGGLRWSKLIPGDLRQHRLIPGNLKLSQVLWIELRRSEVIFLDIKRSEVISGKLKWSPIMSGNITSIRWSEMIPAELKWS